MSAIDARVNQSRHSVRTTPRCSGYRRRSLASAGHAASPSPAPPTRSHQSHSRVSQTAIDTRPMHHVGCRGARLQPCDDEQLAMTRIESESIACNARTGRAREGMTIEYLARQQVAWCTGRPTGERVQCGVRRKDASTGGQSARDIRMSECLTSMSEYPTLTL